MNSKGSEIISLGLDLSLTGTGFVILRDGKILKQGLIKSKPIGNTPLHELIRLKKIIDDIETQCFQSLTINIAVVEGLAFMARNTTALTQLAALNYFVRQMLYLKGVPFVIVAPTSLKKFITGNGASKKDVILMEVFKRWGVTIFDDNCADAYGLAQIGLALNGANSKNTNKTQEEVLSLLKQQYEK